MMHCVMSPAKHVLHRFGNKTVILPWCLSVRYHLKTDTHVFLRSIKCTVKIFKSVNPGVRGHLVVATGAPVSGTEGSDGGARSGG